MADSRAPEGVPLCLSLLSSLLSVFCSALSLGFVACAFKVLPGPVLCDVREKYGESVFFLCFFGEAHGRGWCRNLPRGGGTIWRSLEVTLGPGLKKAAKGAT